MKLLLTFVEGEHDVVFVDRSLQVHAGFVEYPKQIREFPSPLGNTKGGLLARQLEHAYDARLPVAKRPPLPRLEVALHHPARDVLALVYQTKGVTQTEPMTKFLRVFYTLLGSSTWEVTSCAVAVVVDADDVGVAPRATAVDAALRPISKHGAALAHGSWQTGPHGPVGVWVFHDGATGMGTLEDHLDPIGRAGYGPLWAAAETFVDGAVAHAGKAAKFVSGAPSSKRTKAVLTASGQCARPGAPMHGMLAHDMLDGAHFKSSATSRELARFLANAP